MRFLTTTVPLATLTVLAAVGCGNSSGSSGSGGTTGNLAADGAVPQMTSGRYQPLAVGATWSYNVTDSGSTYPKNSQIMSFEDIGGVAAGTMGYKMSEMMQGK